MARIIKFACLIGLRPAEVVESVRLINSVHPGEHKGTRRNLGTRVPKDVLKQYYNPERQCLEHFRFPEIFLRQTKKAYLSFVTPEMLELVKSGYTQSGTSLTVSEDSDNSKL